MVQGMGNCSALLLTSHKCLFGASKNSNSLPMLLDSRNRTYGRCWSVGLKAEGAESAWRQQGVCSLLKPEQHRAAVAEELCRSREQAWLSDTSLQESGQGLEADWDCSRH